MLHLLYDKQKNPEIVGDYDPEGDKLLCPRDKEELAKYFDEKPNHAMPYGFPPLEEKEYITLSSWLIQGAKNDINESIGISKSAEYEIAKWGGEFFELVRSYTPKPKKINIIATLRPFDDPRVEHFYYRFRKIESTIVHKTHMVVKFDDKVLERYKQLFIEPKWRETPHKISYDVNVSTNPFIAYKQIPRAIKVSVSI